MSLKAYTNRSQAKEPPKKRGRPARKIVDDSDEEDEP